LNKDKNNKDINKEMLVNLSIRKNQLLKIYLAGEIKRNSHDFILPCKDPLNYLFLTIDDRLYIIFTSTAFLKIYSAFGGANPRTSWENLTSKSDFSKYLYFNSREDSSVESDFCLEYLIMSYPDLDSSNIPYFKGKNRYYYRVIYLTEVDEDNFVLKHLFQLSNLLVYNDKKELNQLKIINYIKNNCMELKSSENLEIIENGTLKIKDETKINLELNQNETFENNLLILQENIIEVEKQLKDKLEQLDSLGKTEYELKERIKELKKENIELLDYHKKHKKLVKDFDFQSKFKKLSVDIKKEIDTHISNLSDTILQEFETDISTL